jgi:hypothetical protein
MGGLYDAATLHALLSEIATGPSPMYMYEAFSDDMACIVFSPHSHEIPIRVWFSFDKPILKVKES